MSFSMPSYLLGVGTVVGALTLGFGGGVLLTKTAIKDSASGPTRVERVTSSEPLPSPPSAPQVTAAAAPVPRTDPPAVQPVSEPVRQIQTAAEPTKPVADAPRDEPAKTVGVIKPEATGQVEAVRQVEPRQAEQSAAEQWRSPREQRKAEREQRRMERRIEREQRYAERRARALEYVRMRQRPLDEQERLARPEYAFEREEPRPSPIASPLEGLFGRPIETALAERD